MVALAVPPVTGADTVCAPNVKVTVPVANAGATVADTARLPPIVADPADVLARVAVAGCTFTVKLAVAE
jgi:hypothetical protein